MHNNTEGNSPSLAAQKGVGWNRALPSPFKFGNCWKGDGTNDYLNVITYSGITWNKFTIECWIDLQSVAAQRNILAFLCNTGDTWALTTSLTNSIRFQQNSTATLVCSSTAGKHHVVCTIDGGNIKIYIDRTLAGSVTITAPATINETLIGTNGSKSTFFQTNKVDELRLYNRVISEDEIRLNYNGALGNNPSKTEGLEFWYDFELAEADTALWGTNPIGWTSGAWGVRDKTNNNRHAMQVNQTNNSTLGGTLQTF